MALFIAGDKFHPYILHIRPGRNLILHKGIISHLSLLIILDVLIQSHSDSLDQSALCLYSCQIGINGSPAVHYRRIIQDFQAACLFIDFNLYSSGHKRRRRDLRGTGSGSLKAGIVPAGSLCGDGFQGHFSFSLQHVDPFSVKFYFLNICSQHFCAQLLDLFSQLFTGISHSDSCDIGCCRGIRTGIIRRNICIYSKDHNIIKICFQYICRHLGQDRITARTHICSSQA